jgi:hypothetical protein
MSRPDVHRALLQYPLGGDRQWVAFDAPIDTILADELRDVPDAMRAAERAAADGHWVVGMVSYDAGPAFDEAIRSARVRRVPLVSFGVFDAPLPATRPAATCRRHCGCSPIRSPWPPSCPTLWDWPRV